MRTVVVADIHGFYDELMTALDEVKFDPQKDRLISLGDVVDRGTQPKQVIDFLLSLPNKILIKGNHTELACALAKRGYPVGYDWSNCTANTFLQLSSGTTEWSAAIAEAMAKLEPLFTQEIDYYEDEKYIFTHSFIPLGENWREAQASQWSEARWVNPFDMLDRGYNKTGKTICFGHWSCSTGWHRLTHCSEYGDDARFDICHYKTGIALDACTALTHKINALVLEDAT